MKRRDLAILANFKREISLQTKICKDKSKYTRKIKHKNALQRQN